MLPTWKSLQSETIVEHLLIFGDRVLAPMPSIQKARVGLRPKGLWKSLLVVFVALNFVEFSEVGDVFVGC